MNRLNQINKKLWKTLYSAYRYEKRTGKSNRWLVAIGDAYPVKGQSIDILPDAFCAYVHTQDPLSQFTATEKLNARVRIFKAQRVDSSSITKWHREIRDINSKYPTPHECDCLYNELPTVKTAPKLP